LLKSHDKNIKKIKRKETKSYILKKQTKLISNFLGITEKKKEKKEPPTQTINSLMTRATLLEK
jgi:hypothetical protein